MKRLAVGRLVGICVVALGACAPATGPINPGDKIGGFLITTGDSEDIVFVTKLHCPFDNSTNTESCEQPVGTKVNVGVGVYGDDPSNKASLDRLWSEQTHEMTIEGRPVNLQAFGSIDFVHPAVGTVRVWNVVIVSDKPGTVTARSAGVVGGDPFEYTAIVKFTAP